MYGNKRVLVLGLGDSGFSASRWLISHGAEVTVADSRENPPQLAKFREAFPSVSIHLGPFDDMIFGGVDYVVVSPGIAIAEPCIARAIAKGIEVIGDVELFARSVKHWPSKVIAITGSNGKSTVTSLVGHLCESQGLKTVVAGNIGLPVLDALTMAEEDIADGEGHPDVFVLELSSFQLETTFSLHCHSAAVLNISEDHLDRYDGMDGYATAKSRIFQQCDSQVLNKEDWRCLAMQKQTKACFHFGLGLPEKVTDFGMVETPSGPWLVKGGDALMAVSDIPLAGLHNAANTLAAFALLEGAGLDAKAAIQHVGSFKGLAHRVEPVVTVNNVTFIDDSKGTNVGATEAALKGMTRPVLLIAGGDGKGQDFSPLKAAILQSGKAVFLIGKDSQAIADVIGTALPVSMHSSLEDAVEAAWRAAAAGDVILLSPACASLDMFKNYAHRAEVFISAAKQIAARQQG